MAERSTLSAGSTPTAPRRQPRYGTTERGIRPVSTRKAGEARAPPAFFAPSSRRRSGALGLVVVGQQDDRDDDRDDRDERQDEAAAQLAALDLLGGRRDGRRPLCRGHARTGEESDGCRRAQNLSTHCT